MPNEKESIKLCMQVQSHLSPQLDLDRLFQLLESIGIHNEIVERFVTIKSNDDNGYIDILFETMNVEKLWRQIMECIYNDHAIGYGISQSSIVVCEGMNGWNDYLLLHHFNPEEKLDVME